MIASLIATPRRMHAPGELLSRYRAEVRTALSMRRRDRYGEWELTSEGENAVAAACDRVHAAFRDRWGVRYVLKHDRIQRVLWRHKHEIAEELS